MRRYARRLVWAAILIATAISSSSPLAQAAEGAGLPASLFPRPPLLEANVEFWKQIYTEYGVGDFVLHDRDRLGLVYAVVRVGETTNQAWAADRARPEIQRRRAKYQDILAKLAAGVPPEDIGPDGAAVYQAWGCPCEKDVLLRAADNLRVQQGLRQQVDAGMQRAQKLLPRIVSILREHNVPVELAALPLVESSYNPRAYSKAGAAGLWQFIRTTGKQYLTITRKRDDRRDPLRATAAAAHLLRHNYEALGSWPLAIVAYNHGREGIRSAQAAVGSHAIEDIIAGYTGPRFGFASKNFYAEFLAALEVIQPFLGGHGTPRAAKGRPRGGQPTILAVPRAPRPGPAPLAPSPETPPAEVAPSLELPGPSFAPPPAAEPETAEPASTPVDIPALPTPATPNQAEPPIEVAVPSPDLPPADQSGTPISNLTIPGLPAQPTPAASNEAEPPVEVPTTPMEQSPTGLVETRERNPGAPQLPNLPAATSADPAAAPYSGAAEEPTRVTTPLQVREGDSSELMAP